MLPLNGLIFSSFKQRNKNHFSRMFAPFTLQQTYLKPLLHPIVRARTSWLQRKIA